MKHNMNRILTTMALLVLTTITAWAEQKVKITVTPANSGTVTYEIVNGNSVKLTCKPESQYWLSKDYIKAVTSLDGGAVQIPRRIPVDGGTQLLITEDEGNTDVASESIYYFDLPDDQNLNVEVTAEFQSRISIEGATVTVAYPEGGIIYNGTEQKPGIASVVLTTGTALTSADYTVSGYSNNINASNNAEVTVVAQGKYMGSATGTFTITQADMSTVTVGAIANQTFTGAEIKPAVTVTFNGKAVADDEYSVAYSNNINVGTATVTLTSKDKNFSTANTKAVTFKIVAKTLTADMVADIDAPTYTGEPLTPAVTVTDGDAILVKDKDYTVVYADNINAGVNTATATITAKGNYTGVVIKQFTINQAEAPLSYNIYELITAINVIPIWPELNNPQGVAVEYSSSKPTVATIDKDGKVEMKGTGETIIKAAVNDPNYQYAEASYILKVTGYAYNLKIGGLVVTDDNRRSLFNNTVIYDGKERLTLANAHITDIESGLEKLEIYVIGNNVIETTIDDNAILDLTNGNQLLNIITDETKPGTLTMSCKTKVVSGFKEISIKEPMVILKPKGMTALNEGNFNYAVLGTPLDPIVNDSDKNATIDYGSGGLNNQPLKNVVIDDVLYTLNDLLSPDTNDDGIYDGMLVINSITTNDQLQEAIQMIPTSDEYAETFKGITFLVPAGSGTISFTAMTQEGHALYVKVGHILPPIPIQTFDKLMSVDIPYNSKQATYIYVYHAMSSGAAGTPANGSHRIGPKAAVTGITGLSVSASCVDTPPVAQADYMSLSKGDIMIPTGGVGHIIVDNEKVTDLDNDVFGGIFDDSHVSRRSYGNYDISYIDLRGTSITGKEFSREEAPFKGLPVSTLIYLPAGNMVSGPNMVVGSVCDDLLLGNDDYSFECANGGFTATRAVFERPFAADQKQPIYLPFDVVDPEKYGTFFEYGGLTNGVVKMKKTTTVTADTPYYLKAKKGGVDVIEESFVLIQPMAGSAHTGLIGTYNPLVLYSDSYVYDNSLKKFRKAAMDVAAPFEAYLSINGKEDTLNTLWEGEDSPSSVDAVRNNSAETDQWYTLDGRVLQEQPTRKGIYLKNGKKLIVK